MVIKSIFRVNKLFDSKWNLPTNQLDWNLEVRINLTANQLDWNLKVSRKICLNEILIKNNDSVRNLIKGEKRIRAI